MRCKVEGLPPIPPSGPIPPLMPWRAFADWIGMSGDHGTVQGWCERGYLPCVTLGKYRMVNVAKLQQDLLDKVDF